MGTPKFIAFQSELWVALGTCSRHQKLGQSHETEPLTWGV